MPRPLDKRTLGELAIMRDALSVARRDITQPAGEAEIKRALVRVIDVLDAIVTDAPIARTAHEYDILRFRK